MQFEQFRKKMESNMETMHRREVLIGELVYHKYLKDMMEAIRENKYENFGEEEFQESIDALLNRFDSMSQSLGEFDTEKNEDSERAKSILSSALNGIVYVLEELQSFPDNPNDERFDSLLSQFREHSQSILDLNTEMEKLSSQNSEVFEESEESADEQ